MPAFVVFGDVAMSHPEAGIGRLEQGAPRSGFDSEVQHAPFGGQVRLDSVPRVGLCGMPFRLRLLARSVRLLHAFAMVDDIPSVGQIVAIAT
jgi:hypothetical protein